MRPDKDVFKRKGSAAWQHRIFVPSDVRHAYGGRKVLPAKTLATHDLSQANRLARQRVAEYEQEFARVRQSVTAGPTGGPLPIHARLSPSTIEQLAARHRSRVLDQDFAHRSACYARAAADQDAFWRGDIVVLPEPWRTLHQGWSYWNSLREDEATTLETGVAFCLNAQRKHRLDCLREAFRIGRIDGLAPVGAQLLASYSHTDVDRLKLLKRLMEAEIDALSSALKEEFDRFPGIFDEAKEPARDEKESPLLSIASKAWVEEEKTLELTDRRIEDCEAVIALFIEVASDKPIANYTKGDVPEFKEILRTLPANRNKIKETRGLDARQAAKKAQRLGLEPMGRKTANNKYIGCLYNFFEFAIGNYDKVDRNPFENATLPTRSTPRDEWHPFTLDALQVFFNAPLYRGCKSAKHWLEPGSEIPRDSARYWLPLVLLYTGVRVNEACKLRTGDVVSEGDIPFFNVTWEDNDEGNGVAGRVKNFSSVRRVPVHADLISFGLLEFAARMKSAGHERLFPELKPNRYGKLYGTISQRFSDTYLPRLGIKTEKTSLKSFRHNFVDAARNSRIPVQVIQALKGDAAGGTLARYGHRKTDLEVLADEMMKLRFRGLDLDHLVQSFVAPAGE